VDISKFMQNPALLSISRYNTSKFHHWHTNFRQSLADKPGQTWRFYKKRPKNGQGAMPTVANYGGSQQG